MNKPGFDKKACAVLFLLMICLSSCTPKRSENTIINLSFTPWIGFYPFHFAVEKNIPERFGVELRVLETLSVQDFRRTNIKEHVDAFACSMMELTRTNSILDDPVEIVSFLDYSNGADVIIARKDIDSLKSLRDRVVGFDWRSLGHYFLNLALEFEGVNEANYTHRQVEQIVAADYFAQNTLDAYVTYPPISTRLLEDDNLHVIFDSSKIPYHIMDVLAVKKGDEVKRKALFDIWADVNEYIERNPQEYTQFVAKQIDQSVDIAAREMKLIVLINAEMQANVKHENVVQLAVESCGILGNEAPECVQDLEKLFLNKQPISP